MKITDAVAAEHTIYLGVFDQIERALPGLTTAAEIKTVASLVEGLLQNHACREMNLAFKALDHVLAHRGEMHRLHQDHEEIDVRLKQVQSTDHCSEAKRLLKASLDSSREHFQLEERRLFPILERTLSQETLHELGRAWLERNRVSMSAA